MNAAPPAAGSTVGLVITPAPLTITASNQTIQAGSAFAPGTTAFTSSGLALAPNGVVLNDTISGVTLASPTYTGQTVGGTYPINASAATFSTGSASNYTISYVPGTLTTTTNLIITITALAESKIYGSSTLTSPYAITYNGSGIATVSTPDSSLYTVTGLPVGGVYTLNSLPCCIKVNNVRAIFITHPERAVSSTNKTFRVDTIGTGR